MKQNLFQIYYEVVQTIENKVAKKFIYTKILITSNKNTSTSKNAFIKTNSFNEVFRFWLPNVAITMFYNTEVLKLHKFKIDKVYFAL